MRGRGVRNVVFIVLAFLLVGGLVVLARFRPPARVLTPESEEMQRLRFSRTDNAWFALEEAARLIPERPFVDPRTTVDYQFGPMGNLTGIYLPDDDPAHVAWVRGCAPAISRAREALEMEHLLLPVEFKEVNSVWDDVAKADPFVYLTAVMLAAAALEAKEGREPEVVFGYFRDGIRLAAMLHNSVQRAFLPSETSLGRISRLFNPETQRLTLDWLIAFDAAKQPPRRAVEDRLRLAEAWKDGWKEAFLPIDPTHMPHLVVSVIRSGPARRVLAANLDAVIDACCLSEAGFRQWCKAYPELVAAASNSFPGFHPYFFCRWNSSFQNTFNVVELVLAIELYRHAHGAYPDSLEALSPEFLPSLPINVNYDEAFYYRRVQDAYWLALHGKADLDPAHLQYSDIVVSPPET